MAEQSSLSSQASRPIRVVIIDDEPLARLRLRKLLERTDDFVVVSECTDGNEAVQIIADQVPDVIFLDVEMPAAGGFDVIRSLGSKGPAVVFTTAHEKHAVNAFDVDAVDYLLKPFNNARFGSTLERVKRSLSERRAEKNTASESPVTQGQYLKRIAVRRGGRYELVDVHDIELIEGARNYVRLISEGHVRLHRGTLSSLVASLDPSKFVQVQRGTAVNVDCIAHIECWAHTEFAILLKSGRRVTTGRKFRSNVVELLKNHRPGH